MKKLIVIAIVGMMVMGLSVAASAVQSDWQIDISFSGIAGQNMGNASIGTVSGDGGSANGIDGWDAQYPAAVGLFPEVDVVGNAIGTGERPWQFDYRAPLADAKDVQIYNLSAYVNSGSGDSSFKLLAQFNDIGGMFPIVDPGFHVYAFDGSLTQQQCKDAGAGAALWAYTGLNQASAFTSTGFLTPLITVNGSAAHNITLWVGAALPEPGSLLAMFSGLIGLVGYGIRRRK